MIFESLFVSLSFSVIINSSFRLMTIPKTVIQKATFGEKFVKKVFKIQERIGSTTDKESILYYKMRKESFSYFHTTFKIIPCITTKKYLLQFLKILIFSMFWVSDKMTVVILRTGCDRQNQNNMKFLFIPFLWLRKKTTFFLSPWKKNIFFPT